MVFTANVISDLKSPLTQSMTNLSIQTCLIHERVRVKFTGKALDQEYAKQLAPVDNLSLHDIIALDKVQKGQAITEDEAEALRKKLLIKGRKNSYIIAADVARHTEQ